MIRDSYEMHFAKDDSGDTSNSLLMSGSFGKLQEDVGLTGRELYEKNNEASVKKGYWNVGNGMNLPY